MRGLRPVVLACVALVACGERAPAPPPPEPAAAVPAPRRGLWVLCEGSQRVLEHPDRIPALIADADALGVSDLFVQVYRGGRAWFDSTYADATPYRELKAATGEDTLARLRRAVESHRGDAPLFLEISQPGGWRLVARAEASLRVSPTRALTQALEAVVGPGRIRYRPRTVR